MLTKSLVHAGALLALVVVILFGIGCGGGSGPVNVPVDPTPPTPTHDDPVNRIVVISGPWDWGGVANTLKGWAAVGEYTQWQIRMNTQINGQWVVLDEQYTLSYTVSSGHNIAQVSFGLYDKDWRGGWLLKVKPEEIGQGYVDINITGPYAPTTRFHIIISPSGTPTPSCQDLHPNAPEIINGDKWDCVDGVWTNLGPVNPPPDCRDLHPTKEAINGYWWDCIDGVWSNTGVPVNPPPDKDLFPSNGNPAGYYSGQGQQSLTLELQPIPSGVGWINWEITQGPSGAFTVPLGIPQTQCEFYYTAVGVYSVRATPFASESSFDTGGAPVGNYATFTVSITAG